jgi:hypothetical protein
MITNNSIIYPLIFSHPQVPWGHSPWILQASVLAKLPSEDNHEDTNYKTAETNPKVGQH